MELELNERRVLVTGGSKGIGLAIASAFAAEGARVVVGARSDTAELAQLRDEFDVRFVPVDLSTANGPAGLVDAAVEALGGVDVVVNNVGASVPAADTLAHDDAQWQQVLDVTLFSAIRMMRAAVPQLPDDGVVVNVASVNARVPAGMIAPYSAAKAALVNVGKALAEDLAGRGIRVNTVSPGPVRTPMWTADGGFAHMFAEQAGVTAQEVMDRLLPESMAISLGRVAEADEVADLVLFLSSRRASFITGADYVVDGGMLKSIA